MRIASQLPPQRVVAALASLNLSATQKKPLIARRAIEHR
jgi:hypothetical protein